MPWVRIHDGALRNLKVAALSADAFRLWVAGLAHAQEHLTDGEIRHEHLKMLTAKTTAKIVAELTTPVAANRAPLWEPAEHGYQIHDYGQWNDTRAVVIRKRDEKRTRIARWRAARDGPQDASVDALHDAPRDAPGNEATTSTSTTTSTPLKNLVGEARETQPLHGRRNPDLLTYGPVKLWASQFRDEIVPLVATHFGGDRDEAYRPALSWVGELDEANQATTPSRDVLAQPTKWWTARAAEKWGAVSGQSEPQKWCNHEPECVTQTDHTRRWLDDQKAAKVSA